MNHDTSPPHERQGRGGRWLTVTAVVATVAATALTVFAFIRDVDDRRAADEVVVEVEPIVVPTPSTVAPRTEADADDQTQDDPPSMRDGPTTTSIGATPAGSSNANKGPGVSELADLLGPQYSAIPEPQTPRARPVRLDIDAFDVTRFPVRAVGLEPDGQFEVPDETEIGWYQYGATAGQPGATVLAAHVSWNDTTGPFGALGALEPGNRIEVILDDGSTRTYEVFERAVYGKLELPRERIWRTTGPETLVLITCGGDFNPEIRRYRENIVVYAAPIA